MSDMLVDKMFLEGRFVQELAFTVCHELHCQEVGLPCRRKRSDFSDRHPALISHTTHSAPAIHKKRTGRNKDLQ